MSAPPRQFWQQLTCEVLSSSYQYLEDNTDTWRYRAARSPRHKVRDKLLRTAAAFGWFRPPGGYAARMQQVMAAGCFDHIMQVLADDASRELLVKLMAYHILGSRRYRLPVNTPAYWQVRSSILRYVKTRAVVNDVPALGSLDEFDYEGIHLVVHALNILNTFVLEQYHCRRAGISVRQGDIVIEGGAC